MIPEYLFLNIDQALMVRLERFLLIDVRSPIEFLQGHIPGAVNLPLFTNEERAQVGTIYKQVGKQAAIDCGLQIVGPQLLSYVQRLRGLQETTGKREVLIHCFRGGMRSQSMAWLFHTAGIKVSVLRGGYKAYRRFVRESFSASANILILGGPTGSGKSKLLRLLSLQGEQVIDLEMLAHHKGSSFGAINEPAQPTNEQFENNLHAQWAQMDLKRRIWLENESRAIGRILICDPLFAQMKSAPVLNLVTDRNYRLANIVQDYTTQDRAELSACTRKLTPKLGREKTEKIIGLIEANNIEAAASEILDYYDVCYNYTLTKRERRTVADLNLADLRDPAEMVKRILASLIEK